MKDLVTRRLGALTLLLAVIFGSAVPAQGISSALAAGDADPRLQEVLSGWATALGGVERLAAVDVIHTSLKVRMYGLEGQAEVWQTAAGDQRLDFDLAGMFRIVQVIRADGGWQRDQNGKVNQLAGKDLEDQVAGVYLATWSHLLPGRLAGQVELLEPESDTGLLRLRVLPQGGTETLFYLDPKTYLPARSEVPHHGGEIMTTTFSEWRAFDGLLFPTEQYQTTGTPENDMAYTLSAVEFSTPPPAGAFAPPDEEADDVRFTTGNSARDIPLEVDGVHLFLQATLNGSEPLWFVLDTGASISVVDTRLASKLGMELTGKLMGGGQGANKAEVNLIPDVSFGVPGVEVTGQTVGAIALGEILEARFGRAIDGILGYDFISRFVMEIDYERSRLHLYDRSGWVYDGTGASVPIHLIGSQPHCDVVLQARGREPITCQLMIDTGAGSCLNLAGPFTARHDLLPTLDRKLLHEGGFGIGGQSRQWRGSLVSLELGGFRIARPVASFSLDTKGGGADETGFGLLGGRILEQFTVIFDYERERMILEPNSRYGSPIRYDLSGLTIGTGGREDWHHFAVTHVTEGTPGAEAEVRAGDVILAVDGRPATALRKWELTNLFCERGRQVKLELARDGGKVRVVLDLEPYI